MATATLATAILVGGTTLGLASAGQDKSHDAVAPATTPPQSEAATPWLDRPLPHLARARRREPSPTPTDGRVTATGSCAASFYWEPQPTANGETFDPQALTAAHKTLPFDSRVRVTNPGNGKSVTVRINDRGPYIDGRCLDLSRAAFREIADLDVGVLKVVKYEVLAR